MPAITLVGDFCTGHDCFPPRPSISGSASVYINGKSVVRLGDAYATHCCGNPCHAGVLSSASSSVFIEGVAVGRVGDAVNCGSKVRDGSGDVFAGG
jgi:uncharacterized Zn-binding protein involved in type VI secretion